MSSPPAEGDLQLEDLLPDMMTCGSLDPGPDPTWDPDEFPPEMFLLGDALDDDPA
ncbi:MAG: hypothetical protein KDK70_27930 [Myxococcales bacterium]|nr:hypothetical protein [Myxococcales bacterium]